MSTNKQPPGLTYGQIKEFLTHVIGYHPEQSSLVRFGQFRTPRMYPHYWIINLDKRVGQNGTHWTLLWTGDGVDYFYFDSYGLPADKQTLAFLRSRGSAKTLSSATGQIQDIHTTTCGWFLLHAVSWAGLSRRSFFDWLMYWNQGDIEENERRIAAWRDKHVQKRYRFLL